MAGALLEPTEAQLKFVKDICDELNVNEPDDFTRSGYSDFIEYYKDQFYNSKNITKSDSYYYQKFLYWE